VLLTFDSVIFRSINLFHSAIKTAHFNTFSLKPAPSHPLYTHTEAEAATMTKDQNGTWEMESNDNFEGYMKALGKGESS
jgi:hypothetical protein